MIYTITPNPALDLGGMVDQLVPNEKAYVSHETRFPGGNAINAARMIKKFGQPVVAGGFLGGGIGEQVKNLLKLERIQCRFIEIQGDTRISVTVSDRKTHLQTRLSFPGPSIRPSEIKRLMNWISSLPPSSLLIIGGSLPPGFLPSHLKRILQVSNRKSIRCIVDTPGKILKEVLTAGPLLIKPNLLEFQDLIGKRVSSIQGVIREARNLLKHIPYICVSSVEEGALLISSEKVWFGKTPKIRVKTTVGAGDSMVGAMCAQIDKLKLSSDSSKIGSRGDEILRWGLAASAATLVTTGTTLGEFERICFYYPKIFIRKIEVA